MKISEDDDAVHQLKQWLIGVPCILFVNFMHALPYISCLFFVLIQFSRVELGSTALVAKWLYAGSTVRLRSCAEAPILLLGSGWKGEVQVTVRDSSTSLARQLDAEGTLKLLL